MALLSLITFYIDGTFANFDDLSIKLNLPHSSLFEYFQIRQFICNQSPPAFPILSPGSGLVALLKTPF